MEAATLDVADASCDTQDDLDETDSGPEPWGWLFPHTRAFVTQGLVRDEYTFGRGEECDHTFEQHYGAAKNPHYCAISKVHFRIYREKQKPTDSEPMIFIEDKSSNGTFVNGQKIGKNKKRVLNSDDEISLSLRANKVFVFYDCSTVCHTESLPEAFREKYIMSRPLGRGACGEVKLAIEKDSCTKYAVKIIAKKTFSVGPVLNRAAMDEVSILKNLRHPCIISIHDVYDTPTTLYIVLELAEGGELYDRVVSKEGFSEPTAKLYFYQLVMAIKYLHERDITHRDIKPENILLSSGEDETLIKVTDFGLSRFVGENSLMKTLCGTPSYLAPEVLESGGTRGYSKAVDLWSMGVILFIMLVGYPPFSAEITKYSLHDQITNARYSFPEKYWKDVSHDAKDMVRKLLTLDPQERITVPGVLGHAWMKDTSVMATARKLMGGEEEGGFARPLLRPPERKRPACDEQDPSLPPAQAAKRPTLDKTKAAADKITPPPNNGTPSTSSSTSSSPSSPSNGTTLSLASSAKSRSES